MGAARETLSVENVEQLIEALCAVRDAMGWACMVAELTALRVRLIVWDDESPLDRWTLELAGDVAAPVDALYASSSVHVDDSDAILTAMAHSMFEDLSEQLGLPVGWADMVAS